ncbi:Mss4-like protein [Zopfochytrium polystomum]|nr:Mss4-like protein [Zopfochytrium polystomum]
MDGGCACGLVRFRLEAPPMAVHCCHCTSCQRETGSAFALNAMVETSRIALLSSSSKCSDKLGSGDTPDTFVRGAAAAYDDDHDGASPNLVAIAAATVDHVDQDHQAQRRLLRTTIPSDSGCGQQVIRCARCLVALWSHYAGSGPHLAFVRVGTLDDARSVRPDVHIYVRSAREEVRRGIIGVENGDGSGVPWFEEYYPQREGVWSDEGIKRAEALRDRVVAWRVAAGVGRS